MKCIAVDTLAVIVDLGKTEHVTGSPTSQRVVRSPLVERVIRSANIEANIRQPSSSVIPCVSREKFKH